MSRRSGSRWAFNEMSKTQALKTMLKSTVMGPGPRLEVPIIPGGLQYYICEALNRQISGISGIPNQPFYELKASGQQLDAAILVYVRSQSGFDITYYEEIGGTLDAFSSAGRKHGLVAIRFYIGEQTLWFITTGLRPPRSLNETPEAVLADFFLDISKSSSLLQNPSRCTRKRELVVWAGNFTYDVHSNGYPKEPQGGRSIPPHRLTRALFAPTADFKRGA